MQFEAAKGESLKVPCPDVLTVEDCLRYFEEQGQVNSFEKTQLLSCPQRFDHLYANTTDKGVKQFYSPDHHVRTLVTQSPEDISKCLAEGVVHFTISGDTGEKPFSVGFDNIILGGGIPIMPCSIRDVYYGDANRDEFDDIIIVTGGDNCNVPQTGAYYKHCSQLFILLNSHQCASSDTVYSFNDLYDNCSDDPEYREPTGGGCNSVRLKPLNGDIDPITRAANSLMIGILELFRNIF